MVSSFPFQFSLVIAQDKCISSLSVLRNQVIRAALHLSDWQQTDWAGDNPHCAWATGGDWAKLQTVRNRTGALSYKPWAMGRRMHDTARQEQGETSNLNTFITF